MDCIIMTDDEDYDLTNLSQKQRQAKIYYEENKAKILQDKAITIHCECGGHFPKQQKSRHNKGYVHQRFMLNKLD